MARKQPINRDACLVEAPPHTRGSTRVAVPLTSPAGLDDHMGPFCGMKVQGKTAIRMDSG